MNICIFGDSIAWGANDNHYGGWANLLRNYYQAKDPEIEVYNLSISGEKIEGVIKRLDEARFREAEVLIFAIGINNAIDNNVEIFRQHLALLYAQATKVCNKIIFIGLTSVDESRTLPVAWDADSCYSNDAINSLDAALQDWCAEHQLTFVSVNTVLNSEDLDDGLHPNTAGHQKLFEYLKEKLIHL